MYIFPKDLYTDIRIEKVSLTNISLENFELKQNKTRTDQGAMIRIFDGKRWYYSATTDLDNLQMKLTPSSSGCTQPDINQSYCKRLEINKERCLKYFINITDIENRLKLDV